jgi:hypothetical protein
MSTSAVSDQVRYTGQWFRTWSDLQKEDFVLVLTQKLSPAASTITVNGLVSGFQSLDTSGRPPSLFACQVREFHPNYQFTVIIRKNILELAQELRSA